MSQLPPDSPPAPAADTPTALLPVDPTDPSIYRVWTPERTRFSDTDAMGHINNTAIGVYFETARIALFREAELHHKELGQSSVIIKLTIRFLREIHFPADLRLGSLILRIGTTSLEYVQGLFQDDRCMAWSHSVSVAFDTTTRTKRPWTAEQRAELGRYLREGGPSA